MYHPTRRRPGAASKPALAAGAAALFLALPAPAAESFDVGFVTHLHAGLTELDVYVAAPDSPVDAYRVTPGTAPAHRREQVFASAVPVAHDPFDPAAVGPHPKGRPLGMTLEDFLSASGQAKVSCDDGVGRVEARFDKLVADGVYTMWYAFVPMPPTTPFTGALDLPLGARDGSQSVFVADARGHADYTAEFEACLDLSSTQLMAVLAIAWHSDGKTYGSSPGDFGTVSHVQLFAPLPKPDAIN